MSLVVVMCGKNETRFTAAEFNPSIYGRSISRDCGFESRLLNVCLSLVNVVCCQVEVYAMGLCLFRRSPTSVVFLSMIVKRRL